MSEITARPKRRWFRFRLRSLFILVTLCCLAMGWYAIRVLPQKRTVLAIRAAGGNCEYDFNHFKERRFYRFGFNAWRLDRYGTFHWLPDLLGDDLFFTVIHASVQKPSDATLPQVVNLTNLEKLYLDQGSFTDEGLRHLSQLRQLRSLSIKGASITGQGFSVLVDVPDLHSLTLIQCHELTAAGQLQIVRLERLQGLTVVECDSFTADCLRPIAARNNLTRLTVRDCLQFDATQLDSPLKYFINKPNRPPTVNVDPDPGDEP